VLILLAGARVRAGNDEFRAPDRRTPGQRADLVRKLVDKGDYAFGYDAQRD
jgi:hypothetical protein